MKRESQIKGILRQISTTLKDCTEKDDNPGLMTGYCGAALFYAYYHKLTGNKRHLDMVNCLIEKAVTALSQQELMHSHCSGTSGILWCIQHLMQNDFIQHNKSEDVFEEADTVLNDYMDQQLHDGHHDFLHEGLGVALYFLDKLPDPAAEKRLEKVVALLEKASVGVGGGISWKDGFTDKTRPGCPSTMYNLGLAHGMPAILSVLSLCYEKGVDRNKTLTLIQQGIRWLLSAKNSPDQQCLSLFPAMVTADNDAIGAKQSRLGWCYGDLSVAICLWNAGSRLKIDQYKKEACSIFEHVVTHRNKENGKINDASLCHGSTGVSHIFKRMYFNTGEQLFLQGAETWSHQTLELAGWKDGLAGFKYCTVDGYQDNYSLLEGIAGIGLGLIAVLDRQTAPAWDRCLLLS